MNYLEGIKRMFDKILAAFGLRKKQAETPVEPAPAEAATEVGSDQVAEPEAVVEAPVAPVVDEAAVAEMATKLEQYVYDPEVAAELAPIMVRMSAVEGFDKVVELLDAKEKQIEAIGSATVQQSTPTVKPEAVTKPLSATDILRARNQ